MPNAPITYTIEVIFLREPFADFPGAVVFMARSTTAALSLDGSSWICAVAAALSNRAVVLSTSLRNLAKREINRLALS